MKCADMFGKVADKLGKPADKRSAAGDLGEELLKKGRLKNEEKEKYPLDKRKSGEGG